MTSAASTTTLPPSEKKRSRPNWNATTRSWRSPAKGAFFPMRRATAMAHEHAIARYRRWYRKLLHLYSRPYRERFGESMEQTFHDLCRERAEMGDGLLGLVLWMFVETFVGIVRENATNIMRFKMKQ